MRLPTRRQLLAFVAIFLGIAVGAPFVAWLFLHGQADRLTALGNRGEVTSGRVIAMRSTLIGEPYEFTVEFQAEGRLVRATDQRSHFPPALASAHVGDTVPVTYLPSDPTVALLGRIAPSGSGPPTWDGLGFSLLLSALLACILVVLFHRRRSRRRIAQPGSGPPAG